MLLYDVWRIVFTFLEPDDCISVLGTGNRSLFENWFKTKTKSCNDEQRDIIRSILFGVKRFHLVVGFAGVGKTHVLKVIENIQTELHKPITIGAFTGLAAKNAGGDTLHRLFPFGFSSRKFYTYSGIVLIDEVSMVSLPMLIKIMELQHAIKYKLVLLGDFLQLPPIEEKGFIFEYPQFDDLFHIHKLIQPMRHVEKEFINYLHHIAWNEFPPHVVRFLLNRHFAYQQLTQIQKENKLHLYYDREHVKEHNEKCFQLIPQPRFWHSVFFTSVIKKYDNTGQRPKRRSKFTEKEVSVCQQLQKEYHIDPVCLKVGCWIMFTNNLYEIHDEKRVKVPIRNGTRALVQEIYDWGMKVTFQGDLEIHGLVQIERQNIPLYWKQKKSSKLKIGCAVKYKSKLWIVSDIFDDNQVEITRMDTNVTVYANQLHVVERTKHYFFELNCLPCTLSYALTIHKSQGMTLDEIILHISSLPNCHLLYVALGRCRSKKGIYIEGNFSKPRFGVHPLITQFYQKHK